MKFRYRYVNFGTNFQSAAGERTDVNAPPDQLFENEIAVDVGSAPWASNGKVQAVVDNHYYPHEFPSASAGVLHLVEKIHGHFAERTPKHAEIWLVTHRQPDFDAFCAMYLARGVIQGTIEASGWESHGIRTDRWEGTRDEIDWYRPDVGRLPASRRWPVLLAAYASCVDKCRSIGCPRHRELHSVLYAALMRGRPYLEENNGGQQFFEEVRLALSDGDRDLNPLFDSVLEASAKFAPELELLDRLREAYERDIQRARKTVVFLQQAETPFGQWYAKATATPLATAGINGPHLQPEQLTPTGPRRRQVDGIYLRDPKCFLFKEWVRNDLENSPTKQGFTFAGIAYSNERPDSVTNTNSYYFSLDPERADRCHLYNVWARLQLNELAALEHAPPGANGEPGKCRPGYEARAGNDYKSMFDDPWFDGNNYEATIIATPGRGTAIAAPHATADDLSDDPVARLVQEELELAFFSSELKIWDSAPTGEVAGQQSELSLTIGEVLRGQVPRAATGTWRFAQIEVSDDVDLLSGMMAEQIGRLLWRVLDPESRNTVPTDFLERHLVRKAQWVGIWSRQGIVIATKTKAKAQGSLVQGLFQELSDVANSIDDLSRQRSDADELMVAGDELMRRVVRMKHQLTLPENNLVRRFFEAIRLDEVLHSLRDLNSAAAQRAQAANNRKHLAHQQEIAAKMQKNLERITTIQRIIHAVEYLVVMYYGVMLWGHFFPEHNEGLVLLIPAGLSIALVAIINHSVERHWVEWAFIRQTLRKMFRPKP